MIPLLDPARWRAWTRRRLAACAALGVAVVLAGCTPGPGAETAAGEDVASAREIGTVAAAQTDAGEADQPVAEEFMVGEYSFTDVRVVDDGLGDLMVEAEVTNTGSEAHGCILTAYIFSGGSVIGTATGTIPNLAPGETRAAEFRGVDDYNADWDAVTFQIDAEF